MKHTINYLEWDSKFFKIKIGEINIKNKVIIITGDDLISYDLIYLKTNNIIDYKIKGFINSFKQTKVVFSKKITKNKNNSYYNISELNNVKEIEMLYGLAYESGKMSRFNKDIRFTTLQFKSLYRKWIDNALNKINAKGVLVYKAENRILGFVTYDYKNDEAKIGLIGVDFDFQGKGIGYKLINAVEHKLSSYNIKTLNIPTQLENIQACSFYERLGFTIKSKQIINHYWKL